MLVYHFFVHFRVKDFQENRQKKKKKAADNVSPLLIQNLPIRKKLSRRVIPSALTCTNTTCSDFILSLSLFFSLWDALELLLISDGLFTFIFSRCIIICRNNIKCCVIIIKNISFFVAGKSLWLQQHTIYDSNNYMWVFSN